MFMVCHINEQLHQTLYRNSYNAYILGIKQTFASITDNQQTKKKKDFQIISQNTYVQSLRKWKHILL